MRSVTTVRWTALLPGPTTQTVELPFASRDTPACGTRNAVVSIACAKPRFDEHPRQKDASEELGKRARSVTEPVSGLTITSLN